MHQEAISSAVEADDSTDSAVLGLLIDSPLPWHVSEVQRELRDDLAATDSLNRLAGHGLIHEHDGFVWPTRAAIRGEAVRG
jgi:hypothetical protein